MIRILILAGLTGLFICCTKNGSVDKSLVAWVKVNEQNIYGGSVLTLQDGDQFDGIILTKHKSLQWLAGSDSLKRSNTDRAEVFRSDRINFDEMQRIAIVYENGRVKIYQDHNLISEYKADNIDLLSSTDNFVVFGRDYYEGDEFISAEIEDARIYDRALTFDEIHALKPNVISNIKPYAWWDFEQDKLTEKTGRFQYHNPGAGEDIELKDGKLVLQKWGSVIALRSYKTETPQWPANLPDNWLTFHLAHPGPGPADPGDPNPAYFYKGRYHLHYIYNSLYGFAYAHVSSKDMIHWKWHPTVLIPPNTGHGMFSGTGFFTNGE